MVLRDQSTMTEQLDNSIRRFCGIQLRDGLKLVGSLLLSLMLGVFTIVITLHQQNVAFQQRLEDRQIAREQREQDLNISREQRQQDLNMFALQREQDLNISREQRRQDKEIAENKRIQDSDLAEKQRNMSDVQRAHELTITQQQLHGALIVAYMNDISILLQNNNGTLTADPTIAVIARAKTLTAIRQLDVLRKTHLIQFLHEAKQLTSGADPLDLSDAELNGVNFSSSKTYHRSLRNLSLAGALLRNSSFANRDLSNANFSGADLTDARFDKSKLTNADISRTITVRTSFSVAELIDTRFDYTNSRRASFESAIALNATFIRGNMESAIFRNCDCKYVNFDNTQLEKADFFRALLHRSRFFGANLVRVNFSYAQLIDSNLEGARLRNANFSNSVCESAIFTKTELIATRFVNTKLKNVDLTGLDMHDADLSGADLTLTTLSHSLLDNALFNGTIVLMTDFSFASMRKALILDEQLFNAASIRGTTLPNGTKIDRDPNMLLNGHANCNYTSFDSDWQVFPLGAIVISSKYNSPDDCIFVNQINNSAYMSQRANLTRYKSIISLNRTIFVVKVHGSGQISSVRINDHTDRLIAAVNFTQRSDFITLRIQSLTYQPKVTVEFTGYGWCDDIELTVETTPRIA